ncbi:pentatricopeptide repeat-containing protein, mitochondrial [Salvia divinorum]|uniref:Pentatricopeptide repeat-containing protein, mitochondrial n=1 Tax=Salvia divinorum TaxID=28513 RepID=A0ABD1FZR0_SALDI
MHTLCRKPIPKLKFSSYIVLHRSFGSVDFGSSSLATVFLKLNSGFAVSRCVSSLSYSPVGTLETDDATIRVEEDDVSEASKASPPFTTESLPSDFYNAIRPQPASVPSHRSCYDLQLAISMFFTLFKSKRRNVLVRGLHFCKKFTSPGAEDIVFKAICVNISQKKWKFLEQFSSTLTTTLLPRIFQEFRSSPRLLLEFYQRVGGVGTVLCSLESCCILIHVMVECKNFDDALRLMKEMMISKGYSPLEVLEALIRSSAGGFLSSAVFDALVRACTQIGATEDAYEVIEKSRIGGIHVSIHAWNNFLGHLLKTGDVTGFWEMYRKMVSYEYYESVNTYNLLIYALCKDGHIHEALSVFYRMIKAGFLPNIVGFNMLIDGACRADDLDLALNVIENIGTMSRGCVSANVVTYNSLINGYCKQGNPEMAEEILDKMIEMGVKPNVRTYATVIDGYSRKGCLEEGHRLCDRMVENSMIPDAVIYTSFIHWLWMEGDIGGVSLLLSNMMENRVDPDEVTHSMIINGLCRNGHVNEEAMIYLEQSNSSAECLFEASFQTRSHMVL